MATVTKPIALDESLNTTETPSRNIADVLAEGLDDIVTALGGGSLEDLNDVAIVTPSNGQTLKYNSTTQKWENANDAGGHTIYDADESAMTQRAGLGFLDAHVSDDAVNDETEIEIVEAISKTDWDNLDASDASNNGLYEIELPNNTPILTASQVGYGTGTVDSFLDKDTFTITPASGATLSNVECYTRSGFTKISGRVTFLNAVSPGSTVDVGTIPLDKAPLDTVVTSAMCGTLLGVMFVTSSGVIKLRYLSGGINWTDNSFNFVY